MHHPATEAITGPPLVVAHGLYGSGRNWAAMARRMARGRDVVTLDMRNHGSSPRKDSHSYPDMAGDLAQVLATLGPQVDLLGHSMGGKAAMQLALTLPGPLRRLVVADIAPVAYAHDQTQYADAMLALDLAGITTRAEADRRLTPLVPDPALRAFFLQSLDLKGPQGPAWRLNLPVLKAQMPAIVGWPGTQGHFDGPTLFLTGGQSHYVLPEHRDTIRALFPRSRFARLPDAGHWLHAEAPEAFAETVDVFLRA